MSWYRVFIQIICSIFLIDSYTPVSQNDLVLEEGINVFLLSV